MTIFFLLKYSLWGKTPQGTMGNYSYSVLNIQCFVFPYYNQLVESKYFDYLKLASGKNYLKNYLKLASGS